MPRLYAAFSLLQREARSISKSSTGLKSPYERLCRHGHRYQRLSYATTAPKSSDSFTKLVPSIITVIGYGVALYFLTVTMETIPTGVAYAIWSGLGIVLITIAAYFFHGQKIDAMGMLGMALIVAGVAVLNLLSKSAGH